MSNSSPTKVKVENDVSIQKRIVVNNLLIGEKVTGRDGEDSI